MRVLLVDHDSEGLEAVARAIRGVLELDCVTSKGDAMLLLRQNTYDVLIACERCVDGSGLDLLGRTTRTAAPLKRIFAAPADRLQLLGPRLAPFKVQRTISYPIDLEELWLAIAQVTGTNDDTDGTIERVVLDERGIPALGSMPRMPIPPRPPAPLREVRPAARAQTTTPAPAVAVAANAGRAATARVAQPAPEPPRVPPRPAPVRAPAPPASASDTGRMRALPANTSDTGRMRALAGNTSDTGRMRALAAQPAAAPTPRIEPTWTPEPAEDDFAQVAEQARMGVQRKAVDEASRRKRQRLITAGTIAAAVAGILVFLIEQFYDPEARAREQAIAAEVTRMAEQQKVTDNLTLIEIDIEKAIMENNLDVARQELARLVEQSPEHPRREFLQASIDRAAELARLAAQKVVPGNGANSTDQNPAGSAVTERPAPRTPATERNAQRLANDARGYAAGREPDQGARTAANSTRSFGAPLGESVRRTIPLDAPINSEPTPTVAPARPSVGNSFGGRTVEASDLAVGSSANAAARPASTVSTPSLAASQAANQGGSGVAIPAVTAAVTPVPTPAPVKVTPARAIKTVPPVAPRSSAARAGGYVVVTFNVSESGDVDDVEVVESSPEGVFDSAAQAAVRKWAYDPRKENGVAVASTARARLVFEPAD